MGKAPPEVDLAFQRGKSPDYAASMDAYAQLRAARPALNLPGIDFAAATRKLQAYGGAAGGAPSALSRANGLSEDENRMLFATASLDEAMYLIMKGLQQVLSP